MGFELGWGLIAEGGVVGDVQSALADWKKSLNERLATRLEHAKVRTLAEEAERYNNHQGEIPKLIQTNKVEMIQREIEAVKSDIDQGYLFAEFVAERAKLRETLEEELAYRIQHLETLREYLAVERERILIPQRGDVAELLKLGIALALGGT